MRRRKARGPCQALNQRITDALRELSPADRWRVFLFVLRVLGNARRLCINGRWETREQVLARVNPTRRRDRPPAATR